MAEQFRIDRSRKQKTNQVMLRMDRAFYEMLKATAAKEGVSMNALILQAIEFALNNRERADG